MRFLTDTWLVFSRAMRLSLRNPVWVILGLMQPILYLILFVTGIPPSEEQAVKSRGDDYRRYQRETSAFVPLPPRSSG